MEQLIKEIHSTFSHNRLFMPLFKGINTADMSSPRSLQYLMYAAYGFYFTGNNMMTNNVLLHLVKEKFDNNYDHFTWVEGGLLLLIYLKGDNDDILKCRIISTLDDSNEEAIGKLRHKVFNRRAAGMMLQNYAKKVSFEPESFSLLAAIPYFIELLFVKTFHDATFTDEELNDRIAVAEQQIRAIIQSK